jgi:hypothetical protein
MTPVIALLALIISALGAAPAATQHPDMSGTWVLDRAHSSLEYPKLADLDSATIVIEHSDARFTFSRRFLVAGTPDTLTWTLAPDGPVDTSSEGGRQSLSRLRWSGDTLLLEIRIVAPRGEAGDTVRYRLLDGGRVFQAQERFRAPRLRYDNLWVFTRRPAN